MPGKSCKNSNTSDDMPIEQPEEQFTKLSAEMEKKPEIPDEIREAKEKKWAEWTERAFKSNQQSSQQEDVLSAEDDVNHEFIKAEYNQEVEQERQSSSSSDKWNGVADVVLKGAWKTAGSIFGFRVIEETVKLVSDAGEKGEQKKELVSMTRELAENVSEVRRLAKEQFANADDNTKKESKKEAVNPVREKMKALNEKLANSNLPDNEKEQMRKEITYILREYNNKSEEAEIGKRDKIKELMDLYINNKAQGMLVAKEALNTASIALAQPYLRILGYSGFAVAERVRKANEMYDKTHFRESGSVNEKLKAIAKDLFINSAVETVNGFNVFNKEKSYLKRSIDFASSVGVILRFVGLAEYERAIQAGTMVPAEGAKKLLEAVEEGKIGDALGQMGENWLGNAKRLLVAAHIIEKEESGIA